MFPDLVGIRMKMASFVKRLLLIDNYDSFTYNLVHLFKKVDKNLLIDVIMNDQRIDDDQIIKYDYICISPGPSTPKESGISNLIIKKIYKTKPMLGVCLGMQCIASSFGNKIVHAPYPTHGKTCVCINNGTNLFRGFERSIEIARYHSLIVEDVNQEEFSIDANSEDGVIQAITHKKYPIFGIQFHPESFMAENGEKIILNFLNYDC
jgi:anthranilate synthase component 2